MRESEDRIQSQCYTWFHNNYPQYRMLLNYNLNNSKNAIDGRRNKALGLQAGRADMTLYFEGSAYFLEFKTPTGTQQKIQKEFQAIVEHHGFEYFIIRDIETFKSTISYIISKRINGTD